jgi:hypothetical protein
LLRSLTAAVAAATVKTRAAAAATTKEPTPIHSGTFCVHLLVPGLLLSLMAAVAAATDITRAAAAATKNRLQFTAAHFACIFWCLACCCL